MIGWVAVHKKTGKKYLVKHIEPGKKVTVARRITRFSVIDGQVISVHTEGTRKFLVEFMDIPSRQIEITEVLLKEINGERRDE